MHCDVNRGECTTHGPWFTYAEGASSGALPHEHPRHHYPSKMSLLMTISRPYNSTSWRGNVFPLNPEIVQAYRDVCNELWPTTVPDGLQMNYPLCHLTRDRIWALAIRGGKEDLFRGCETSYHRRLNRRSVIGTTDSGRLSPGLDRCLRSLDYRHTFMQLLRDAITDRLMGRLSRQR